MIKDNNFFKKILFIGLILCLAIYGLNMVEGLFLPPVLYVLVVGLGVFTYFAHGFLAKSRPNRFISSFMGVLGLKMFGSLIFLAIYLFIDPTYKMEVAFGLFAIYMSFNILLIAVLNKRKPSVETN